MHNESADADPDFLIRIIFYFIVVLFKGNFFCSELTHKKLPDKIFFTTAMRILLCFIFPHHYILFLHSTSAIADV